MFKNGGGGHLEIRDNLLQFFQLKFSGAAESSLIRDLNQNCFIHHGDASFPNCPGVEFGTFVEVPPAPAVPPSRTPWALDLASLSVPLLNSVTFPK